VEAPEFDKAYVDRLADGDGETTEHFVKRFYTVLVVKLRAKMRSSNQAEDMAQETLYRVLRTLKTSGSIEHPERLAAYVRGVSENVLLETIRQGGRFQQVPENTPEPVERALDAERSFISKERKENIRRELEKLAPKDRKLLKKVFLDEQDKDEICQELNIDRNYLRVQVHRALARFRMVLGKNLDKNSAMKAKKLSRG
jgi:RNA polymerase sigma-70 factor (ECF subfamily)